MYTDHEKQNNCCSYNFLDKASRREFFFCTIKSKTLKTMHKNSICKIHIGPYSNSFTSIIRLRFGITY